MRLLADCLADTVRVEDVSWDILCRVVSVSDRATVSLVEGVVLGDWWCKMTFGDLLTVSLVKGVA